MTTPHPHDADPAAPNGPNGPNGSNDPNSPAGAGEARKQPSADGGARPGPGAGTGAGTEHTVTLSAARAAAGPAPQQTPASGDGDGTVLLAAQAPPPPPQPPTAPPAPMGAPAAPPAGAPQPPPAAGWPPPQTVPAVPPVQRAHLGHALASEWTKIRTVRSTLWTLGVMFAVVVGIGALMALAFSGSGRHFVTTPLLGGGLFGLMLGQVCIITLGVLVVTSEYGTGMIRTTMTACPARGRVLLAKAIVFFLVAFVMTTLAAALTALIQVGMLGGEPVARDAVVSEGLRDSVVGGEQIATGAEWLDATVGAGLYVALLGLLSLAVGAMLRHSAGAITAMLGVVLLPMLVALFLPGSLEDLRNGLLEYSPLNGLAAMFHMPFQGEVGESGWPLLGLLAAVSAAALAGAYAALTTRDV